MSVVDALQECLSAEHAALYGYGVLGGRLAGAAEGSTWQALADVVYAEHRARRDHLTRLLVENEALPVPAEPAYATPFEVETLSDCRRLATLIESRCSAVYADSVSLTAGETRAVLARWLADCAVRAVEWGQPIRAFPGALEL